MVAVHYPPRCDDSHGMDRLRTETQMTQKPNSQGIDAEGAGIKDAIAAFMVDTFDMDMQPMVGGFTLIAEVVDPDTGQTHCTAIQSKDLSLWSEYGLLALRLQEVAYKWQMGD